MWEEISHQTDQSTTHSRSDILRDLDGDRVEGPFCCPISKCTANGTYRFVAIKTCGHVYSIKAMQELDPTTFKFLENSDLPPTDVPSPCLVCSKNFDPKVDIIEILPTTPSEEESVIDETSTAVSSSRKKRPIDQVDPSQLEKDELNVGIPPVKKAKLVEEESTQLHQVTVK